MQRDPLLDLADSARHRLCSIPGGHPGIGPAKLDGVMQYGGGDGVNSGAILHTSYLLVALGVLPDRGSAADKMASYPSAHGYFVVSSAQFKYVKLHTSVAYMQ
jgi:hypothetical protein